MIPACGELFEIDYELISAIQEAPEKIGRALDQFKFRDALNEFMGLARAGNKYLAETEPWKQIKEHPERVQTILHLALQVVANLSILGDPFLPFSMEKLRNMLNLNTHSWADAGSVTLMAEGHVINKPELMFEKIEDDVIQAQVDKLEKTRETNAEQSEAIPLKAQIQFDDFMKLDMRVGTITAAEKMPKSKKLLKLTVDTGVDVRTVLSGIAEHFSPEEVLGKQVTILVNLAPRKMMGVESQGMILMAENEDGSLHFMQPGEAVSNGSVIS